MTARRRTSRGALGALLSGPILVWTGLLAALLAGVFATGFLLGRGEHPLVLDDPTTAATGPRGSSVPAATGLGGAAPVPVADLEREGATGALDRPGDPTRAADRLEGLVALIIDDLGRDLGVLSRLEALGVPISYAVLPFESRTREVAAWLAEREREILVHLPMQAAGAADPGPGALYSGMSASALRTATTRALEAVPEAVGVNNHMGSALSADPAAMRSVLEVLAQRGSFFVDSRTSAQSVGFALARSLGIPAAERAVFLDTEDSEEWTEEQWTRLLEVAGRQGSAVAIGHPYPSTLAVLERRVPEARARGLRFVPVSALLERAGRPEDS